MILTDTLHRPLRDLRISVTDRCNFRCVYCMPKEVFGPDYQFLPRAQILTFEELARLVRIFVAHGVRKIRFLEPMTASILSNNRIVAPFGMAGGEPGRCGRNYVIRNDGSEQAVSVVASTELQAGEVFVIETPGGGGYGEATE